MKQPMRLKSGGFMSSGTDAGDLAILRTAKNIDDGSAMGMKNGGKLKTRKKQKEVAELKRKAEAKKNLSKSGPPSKKELVSSVRREMQMREKFKTSTPKIMKAKEKRVISNRIGEPKTLKATRRRRKLDEDILKKQKQHKYLHQ